MGEAMLADVYTIGDERINPLGYYCSEKLDGYRAIFKEGEFYSRNGKIYTSPLWFKKCFPKRVIDGELWISREDFEKMGCVRKKEPVDSEWMEVTFQVYDLIDCEGNFETRLKELLKIVKEVTKKWNIYRKKLGKEDERFLKMKCPLRFVTQTPVKSLEHLKELFQDFVSNGAEGIMIKDPNSLYEPGKRSKKLLKIKPCFDAEGIVIGYKPGKGKYKEFLGAFECKQLVNHDTYSSVDENKSHIFSISGMDDEVRKNYKVTHPVGTIISYEHSGITGKGVPRFARYLRVRDDIVLKSFDYDKDEMKNKVCKILKTLGDYEKMNKESFKASSYYKALKGINSMDKEFSLENVSEIKGIGKSIYEKIEIVINTGTHPNYEKITERKDPREDFMKIYGVGPGKAKDLMNMGYDSIQSLRGSQNLEEILNEKQLIGLKYYEDVLTRIPYDEITDHEKFLKSVLKELYPETELTIAGSYRRKSETSGDIDVLIKSDGKNSGKKIMSDFVEALYKKGYMFETLALGNKKFMGISKISSELSGRRIDIMVTTKKEYPFAILYFTGSAEFNPKMRQRALDQGYSLNEYSLTDIKTKLDMDKEFLNEKDIFKILKMEYVEPHLR